MFCPNCGNQIPDSSKFCPNCGASVSAAAPQDGPTLTQDPALPEGIFCDESGAYHWVYHLDMKKNPEPLRVVIKLIFGVTFAVALLVAVMLVLGSNGVGYSLMIFCAVGGGLGAVMALVAWCVWLVEGARRGWHYLYEYLMTEERVVVLQTPEEQAHSEKLAAASFVLSVVNGSPTLAAAGTAALAGVRVDSVYKDVRKVIAVRRHDLIKVNNRLMHNVVYADARQYDFVWSYITSHCPNAKIKG